MYSVGDSALRGIENTSLSLFSYTLNTPIKQTNDAVFVFIVLPFVAIKKTSVEAYWELFRVEMVELLPYELRENSIKVLFEARLYCSKNGDGEPIQLCYFKALW